MKMIKPNCRVQFAAEDVEFILSVLGGKIGGAECLIQLLSDEDARDLILDDEALFHALLERRGCLRVSGHFYFYILVRNVFLRSGMDDRTVADYVAEVLAEFSLAERSRCVVPGGPNPLDYFFEMLSALRTADDRTGFFIRAHIGNYSLFLSGVFPDRIRFRAEARGFPDVKYYDALGRTHYRAASDHRLAQRYEVAEVFSTLSDHFETTRRALNDIADRLFSIGDPDYSLETLLGSNRDNDLKNGTGEN
ncbi:MAG TPA: hypothetical protein VFM25_02780 [Verrucomicrobiae bacterium]|nr:hypothetical protein [Verrucomicrobiae bacterium]